MSVNTFAGMGSHQSSKSGTNDWFTPPAIIEALGGADSFDLDPCSADVRPFETARAYYTAQDNGLLLPWFGRVYLNPPYSNPLLARFMARMAAHACGIALIFARTETKAFHRYVWGAATGILFLRGRLNFHLPSGERAKRNGGAPSVLISYGDEDRDILAAAPIDGQFMPLRLPRSLLVMSLKQSWAEALADFFSKHEGPVELGAIYQAFATHPKARRNPHFRDKIRQVVQRGAYERVERGVWQKRAA